MTEITVLGSIFKGLLAGISIAFGGLLSVGVRFAYRVTNTVQTESENICSAIAFAAGLLIVCSCKLMLYTGKAGMVFENVQKCSFYFCLLVMLVFNAVGAIGFGVGCHYLCKWVSTKWSKASIFQDLIDGICSKRVALQSTDSFIKCSLNALLCGYCVYMAVKCFNRKTTFTNVLLLVFYVALFVYSGYEHCIANMFYLAFGMKVDEKKAYIDVAICVIGNLLGTLPGVYTMTKGFDNQVDNEYSLSSSSYSPKRVEFDFGQRGNHIRPTSSSSSTSSTTSQPKTSRSRSTRVKPLDNHEAD